MKAILTRYRRAAQLRLPRILASNGPERLSFYLPREANGKDIEDHRAAVRALCHKMRWHGALVGGQVSGGWVWVWLPKEIYDASHQDRHPDVLYVGEII